MSGRRGRGKAKESPARGRGRGRGRGKAQANSECVNVDSESSTHACEEIDPINSVCDEPTTSELNAINDTNSNDPVESCIGNMSNTRENFVTKLEPEVETNKESDTVKSDTEAAPLAVNVTDGSLEPRTNEPEVINLDSDDDDDEAPTKVNEEKELTSFIVKTTESFGLEASDGENNVYDASDVINLDDEDEHDDSRATEDEHHFYCTVCDIECKTKQGFENHEKGFYHCQRVKTTTAEKTFGDEEEKQAVDAAAAAEGETNQAKDEEEMEIEMDAAIIEAADPIKADQNWILLDEMDEGEEEKSEAVTHKDSSAAEGKEESETARCDESNQGEASGNSDEQIKGGGDEDDCSVESSDNLKVAAHISSKKEAKDNVPAKKLDDTAATHRGGINSCTVNDTDNGTGICDVKDLEFDVENKELSESGSRLSENPANNIGLNGSVQHTGADGPTFLKKKTGHAESKEIDNTESNETEAAATAEESREEDDATADPYYCAACDVRCENDKAYHMHTRGMMHTLNCGSSSSAAERPKPVPQVYRVPKTTKEKSKSLTKKSNEKKPAGEGTEGDVILIDDDESAEAMEEQEDVGVAAEEPNSKEYDWLGGMGEDAYYCDVCDCSMTSEQNYESHLIGARHKKNKKNRDLGVPVKKPKGKVAIGGHQAKVVDCQPQAQDMLNNCKDALIGLQYMTEYCHSSPDVEPRYVCNLCEAKCDIRMVVIHVTGLKHRINYMKEHHTNYAVLVQQRVRKSDQTPLADQFAKEIEASEGRQKMVVRMDMSGSTASESATKETKDEQETASHGEPRKRRASPGRKSKSPSGRTSATDIRPLLSLKDKEMLSRARRHSRSDSRHRNRSPNQSSSRHHVHSSSRDRHSSRDERSSRVERSSRDERSSRNERTSRDHSSYRRDNDRDRFRDRRSGEQDRYDRDSRGTSPERRRRSDYNRYEQDTRTEQSFLSAAQALYACGTNYPYSQTPGVPYGLVSPAAFAMGSSYPAVLNAGHPAFTPAPPSAKRSRLSDASAASLSMPYASSNLINMYGSLGAAVPYATPYGAKLGPPPQPVPPVTPSPLPSRSSTGHHHRSRPIQYPLSQAYGTKLGGDGGGDSSSRADDHFSTLSSIVAGVSTGARDDNEAAAMSKVIAEAVIKYKMQKAQDKSKQSSPSPDRYQRRY